MPLAQVGVLPGGPLNSPDVMLAAQRELQRVELPLLELDSFLATVLFTDIVALTETRAVLGDHAWKDVILRHHAIVRDALKRWRGVEVDTAGDGLYATFDGPARAIPCAVDITHRVRELGIEVRAGVHTGECEIVDGKCAGIAVVIGSRIAGTAGPRRCASPRRSRTWWRAPASRSRQPASMS